LSLPHLESLYPESSEWLSYCEQLRQATSLPALVWIALQLGLWFARKTLETELSERASAATIWPECPHCKRRMRSKGFRPRQMKTLIGLIQWQRRVGECPNRTCKVSLSVPFDEALGILPYQSSSEELKRLGCLLSVVMPYELSSWMLYQCSGISVSASTLWNWVESYGQVAMKRLETQLEQFHRGETLAAEVLDEMTAALNLAIAADGVMVPFRPYPQSAKGKTQWREVKVGLLARLGQRLTRAGKTVTRLYHRRLVAVLGDIEAFIPRIQLEAFLQSVDTAPQVLWLSDGGRGFWRVYRQCFAHCAIGILDFYHAAGHLWRATAALFDCRSAEAMVWFKRWRSLLRHGHHLKVLNSLTLLINAEVAEAEKLDTLIQVQAYFQSHHRHIRYQQFKDQNFPLGSGMIESACKWLIQQRFKGVGMRWSEAGFNHLLHLRLAWVNQRFDAFFPLVHPSQFSPSHNR
jgi:hypothetical protein